MEGEKRGLPGGQRLSAIGTASGSGRRGGIGARAERSVRRWRGPMPDSEGRGDKKRRSNN